MLSKIVGFGRKIANACKMLKDKRGEITLLDWIKGVIAVTILGVGVAIPIVVNTIQSVNVSDPTTKLVLGFIPPVVAVSFLMLILGGRE
ncbi:hypothetical protein [Archaeoglobus profundus]|uniref:Uncharacterized protein n=1 Tax=Archaeoglobus profundus (strain DSM 5631 / JCM 9629 / NBRC 100127 / Av18) TaxID=572546 RepID=D2RI82_ARCPA|nr:hypothetical protein [Archaeoglobus profundus]ADB58007.1 hypothetical protein Arcpr_0946 [Archaeoglobus profundus DSM 5631]